MKHLTTLALTLLLAAATPSASRAAVPKTDDSATKEAIADIIAHRKWVAANVDTVPPTHADLLRAAADAAATLSREPAYTAVLARAARVVPGLDDYVAFRQGKGVDTADVRKTAALEAIAAEARRTCADRPDVEARALYHLAAIEASTDTAAARAAIARAYELVSGKAATGVPRGRINEDRMLYGAMSLFIAYAAVTGDTPETYAARCRLEHDAMEFYSTHPDTPDKATLFYMLAILRMSRGYADEAAEADMAEFGGPRPAELPDSVSTDEWRQGQYYMAVALAAAKATLGSGHPDAFALRLETLPPDSPDYEKLFAYALAYWPIGTPMLTDVKMAQWVSCNCAEPDAHRLNKYITYLNIYRDYYGAESQAYAAALRTMASIMLMRDIAKGYPGEGSRLAKKYIALTRGHGDDMTLEGYIQLMTLATFVDGNLYRSLADEAYALFCKPVTGHSWTRAKAGGELATMFAQSAEHNKALNVQRTTVASAAALPGIAGRRQEAKARYDLASLYETSGQPADSLLTDTCWAEAVKAYERAGLDAFIPAMRRAKFLAEEFRLDDAAALAASIAKGKAAKRRKAYRAAANILHGRIRQLQGFDDDKTRRLMTRRTPELLADTAALPSVAVDAYAYLGDWLYAKGQLGEAERMLQAGLERARHITDNVPGYWLKFTNTLFNIYMAQGEDYKAERLNERMIAYIDENDLRNTTTFLDCLWNRVLITQRRTPNDYSKMFAQCTEMIAPAFQVYIRSGQSKEIEYTYLLRLYTSILNNGVTSYKILPDIAAMEDGRQQIKKLLAPVVLKLEDIEKGYPEYVKGANYKVLPEYMTLVQTLANYYRYVESDTTKSTRYCLLAAEADSLCMRPWAAAQTKATMYVMKGDFASALPYNTECYDNLDKFINFDQMQVCRWQSELCRTLQKTDEAIAPARRYAELVRQYVVANFDYLSSDERARFIADHSTSGLLINQLLPARGQELAADAYDAALFDKGLLLHSWERIRRAILRSGDAALISRLDTLESMNTALRAIHVGANDPESAKRMNELQSGIERIEKYLAGRTAAFRTDTMRTVTWQQVRDALKPSEAAIEFVATDTAAAALIVKPGCELPIIVPIDGAGQVTAMLRQTDNMPADTRVRRLYRYGRSRLYDLLWRDIDRRLGGVGTIYFSPTGELNRIAFAAIPISADSCLIDRYDLRQLSTTAELTRGNVGGHISRAALFGGINYSPGQGDGRHAQSGERAAIEEEFAYLGETRHETDTIAKCMLKAGIDIDVYSGDDATEPAFYSLDGNSPAILHIATHGFFIDMSQPADQYAILRSHPAAKFSSMQRTGLAFAGANATWGGAQRPDREDGILTANELSLLDLGQTRLAVLSACETGLGTYNTEGVWGLQRGFKEAGVHTLVMSLWNVNDRATSEFMQAFYRHLTGGSPMHDAFDKAVAELRRTHPDPFFWAAFILLDGIR